MRVTAASAVQGSLARLDRGSSGVPRGYEVAWRRSRLEVFP